MAAEFLEKNIIERCLKEDRKAQKALYDLYAPRLRSICHRYAKDKEEAKDFLQDGFIKIFKNLNTFSFNGSFEGWMKRIVINTALGTIKKKRRLSIESIDPTHEHLTNQSFDNNDGSEELLYPEGLSHERLLFALNNIPENYRLVFNLYCIEEYSHKEISDILGIEEVTSRSRLSRAKKILKEELSLDVKNKTA